MSFEAMGNNQLCGRATALEAAPAGIAARRRSGRIPRWVGGVVALTLAAGLARPPAFAAPPSPVTAHHTVTVDGVKLGSALTPNTLRSTIYAILFDPTAGVYHLWYQTNDTFISAGGTNGIDKIRHAVSTNGLNFTATGNLSYASNPFSGGTPFGYNSPGGQNLGEQFFNPKIGSVGGSYQLVLWTFHADDPPVTFGDYDYSLSFNSIGSNLNNLVVTHEGPIGPVPTYNGAGVSGQTLGPWGIVNGKLYYENNGQIGRTAFTINPQPFPTTYRNGPWTIDGCPPPPLPCPPSSAQSVGPSPNLVDATPGGYGYCSGAIPAYLDSANTVIDNGDGTIGLVYALISCVDYETPVKQVFYTESGDDGVTWATPVGVFADPSLVTVDGAATSSSWGLFDVATVRIPGIGGQRLLYFATQDAAGNYVVAGSTPCGDRYVDATGTDTNNFFCLDPAQPCRTIQHGVDTACPGDTVNVAPGTYTDTSVGCSPFCGATVVEINKPLTVRSTAGPASTIIDGNSASGNYYVVRIDSSDVVLDGFTITNPRYGDVAYPLGIADASGVAIGGPGPGYSNIRITNCIIHDVGLLNRPYAEFGTYGINSGPVDGLEIDHCQIYNIANAGDASTHAIGIFVWGDVNPVQNVNIHHNSVHNISHPYFSIGINAGGGSQNVVIDHNTVSAPGDYGIRTSAYCLGNVTISNNAVQGAEVAGLGLNSANPYQEATSNSIVGCATGVAVSGSSGSAVLHFNRIVGNTTGLDGQSSTTTDAENNWWGCNAGPNQTAASGSCFVVTSGLCDTVTGNVDFTPWLVLRVTPSSGPDYPPAGTSGADLPTTPPATINQCDTSTLTADITYNSECVQPADPTLTHIPDGVTVYFNTTVGSINPTSVPLVNGSASATFYPDCTPGDAIITAPVDNESAENVLSIDPSSAWILSRAKLRANRPTSNQAMGSVSLNGNIDDNDTAGLDLETSLLNGSVYLEVDDSGGFHATLDLRAAAGVSCIRSSSTRIKCTGANVNATFKVLKNLSRVYSMRARTSKLNQGVTGTTAPVEVVSAKFHQEHQCRYDCIHTATLPNIATCVGRQLTLTCQEKR